MTPRILACDDESFITRSISMKLAKAGYEVVTAADGQQALDLIRTSSPDLLITDCQMPRMNGLELCRQLRADPATANLPVILLTAKGYELDRDEVQLNLRVQHIVAKPFSPRELLKLVDELAAGPQQPAGTDPAHDSTNT